MSYTGNTNFLIVSKKKFFSSSAKNFFKFSDEKMVFKASFKIELLTTNFYPIYFFWDERLFEIMNFRGLNWFDDTLPLP